MAKLIQPLPCPFCGEIPAVEPWHGGSPKKRMVACYGTNCAVCPQVADDTRKLAVEAWNRRAPSKPGGAS